jgi:hypothetical protein
MQQDTVCGVTVEGSSRDTHVVRRVRDARRLPMVLGLQLRHRLGAGGEGEVWAADTPGGVVRAVKLIRPAVLADPVTFEQRARDLTRIDDPALVQVHRAGVLSSGDWAGWGAMVMDLVDGEPLDTACLGARAYRDLRPLAEALDRLHAGVWSDGYPLVHRDVKPSNLIRTPGDGIVLVDPSSLRGVGGDMTFVGTPLFVAPEVASGRFGPGADVYSFAATLVALHSGARDGELAGLLSDPESLDVPDAVARALSAVPSERPTRCVELTDHDTPATVVGARAALRPEHAHDRPQTRRTWWRFALLSAAAIPIVIGLVLNVPLAGLGGLAALVGLLALDPDVRDGALAWLPLACARWLGGTLEADDDERARVTATIHGALLVPLMPVVGLLVGMHDEMVVFGTVGQLMGVGIVCGLAIVGVTLATAGAAGSTMSPARVMLLPAWVGGVFALAVGRVAVAIGEALSAADARLSNAQDPEEEPADGTSS